MGNIKNISIFATIVLVAIISTYLFYFKTEYRLPIYQPSDVNPALVDAVLMSETDHHISDFTLINQLGDTIHLSDVEGQILIVDFFFTRCATICPLMTSNLKLVHDRLPEGNPSS
jgi:protein SCO1/2